MGPSTPSFFGLLCTYSKHNYSTGHTWPAQNSV
jgi:hypothetical protein